MKSSPRFLPAMVRACSLVAMLLLVPGLASAQANRNEQVFEREDAYITESAKHFFRGAVLVGIDGKIAFEKGYGIANEDWNIPNTPRTKFRIGSVTKEFTAACILLLQERGRLRVEDAVSKYLSGLPPAWQPITIHQLLTHTSGIPDYTNSGEFGKFQTTEANPQQIISLVTKQPLDFAPGAKWVYSSTNYILLGMIIEKASGQSYATFLTRNIFEHLGMTNSGYDRAFDIVKERATGYQVDDNSRLGHADDINMSVAYAAGGAYSTVEDLYRWSEALTQGGRLLTAASLKQMFTGYAETAKGRHYGYGVFVAQLFGRLEYFHTGAINGFTASVQQYPNDRVCIIVLSNMDEFIAWDLGDHIASDLFGQLLPAAD